MAETTLATTRHRSRARLASAVVLVGLLALAGCGSSSPGPAAPARPTTSSTVAARPALVGDAQVAVGGGRLHVRCVGRGAATVVLIPGYSNALTTWDDVETAIAPSARVCSYERFGNGTSDAPPSPQTFAGQAADLHGLLEAIHVPGPYVVVGHSLGGTEAVMFASMFRAEVTGLLLVDATPPNWGDAVCAVEDNGTDANRQWRDLCASMQDPAKNQEHLDSATAYGQAKAIGPLGKLPLIADTAVNDAYADGGLGAGDVATLKAAWSRGQAHWVALSSNARLQSIESSHHIHRDHPDLVIRQIHQLLVGSIAP